MGLLVSDAVRLERDDSTTVYTWDYHNRLTDVTTTANSGAVTKREQCAYDVFDRRMLVRDVVSGTEAYFVHDGNDVALEYARPAANEPVTLDKRYLHGPGTDQLLAIDAYSAAPGVSQVVWPLTDRLGTLDGLYSDGRIVCSWDYDVFGRVFRRDADDYLGVGPRFGGREYSAITGLYYNRARYYDPTAGRFLSEDPLSFAAGDANLYRYVGNSPTNGVDPSGHIAFLIPALLMAGGMLGATAAYRVAEHDDNAAAEVLPPDRTTLFGHGSRHFSRLLDLAIRGVLRSWLIWSTYSITPRVWRIRCSPAGSSSNP